MSEESVTSNERLGVESSATVRSLLHDSVADFAARICTTARTRRLRAEGQDCEPAFWSKLAELGWLGILVPEDLGGIGLGISEAAIVAEKLSAGLTPEPFNAMGVMTTTALVRCAANETARNLLAAVVSGETMAALAWQEEAGELEVDRVQTSAMRRDDRVVLTGTKRYVLGCTSSQGFIVSARAGGTLELYWVPAGAGGVTCSYTTLADGRHFGTVHLQDVVASEDSRLAHGETAAAALEAARDFGTIIAGAELLGVMTRALDMSAEYMRNRVQFGKAIGTFQALQHSAVDLYIQQQLSSAVLDSALRVLQADPDSAQRKVLASRVKARCSEAASRITKEAIQFHGAMGFTDEFDAGLYLKRALVLTAWLGNVTAHRRRYARYSLEAQI